MKTHTSFEAFLTAARENALRMLLNAEYIRRELPSLQVPEGLRADILELCDDWCEAKHDAFSLIFDISDIHAEGADIRQHCARLLSWLTQASMKAHAVIIQAQDSAASSLVTLLVTESAVNVLNANSAAHEAWADHLNF
ncbi:MAG TPA: hypothetical protein DIT13_16410 [Verrucomicrobiales bacterium]|nr:hypothetical protein [Verrucomicrobiales bacterium]HRJ07687.1 hypothetical protein [Prosthecobacter sp.]HRK15475.1 hypothetical protein [Prosthecobacter sp.]